MKLTERKNEDALDLLADILEPVATVFADTKIMNMYKSKTPRVKLVQYVIKNHKESIIEVLAALDGVPVAEYDANVLKMTAQLLEIINDEELVNFFTSLA